jgi:hypothetical protein
MCGNAQVGLHIGTFTCSVGFAYAPNFSTDSIQPPFGRIHIPEHLYGDTDALREEREHPRHSVKIVIGCHNRCRAKRDCSCRSRGPLNQPSNLLRRDIGLRASRIEQLWKVETTLALFFVEVAIHVLKGHDAVCARQHPLVKTIEDMCDWHDAPRSHLGSVLCPAKIRPINSRLAALHRNQQGRTPSRDIKCEPLAGHTL